MPQVLRVGMRLLEAVSPAVAGGVAARLFFRPRRFERPQREKELLARARPFRVRWRGRELAAWEWGEGDAPTILFVHGWMGRGSQVGPLADLLTTAGLHVVAFDGPAHGDSPGVEVTLPEFADATATMIELLGGVEGLVAHSFGAPASTLAISRGAQVGGAVFVAPAAFPRAAAGRLADAFGLSANARSHLERAIVERVGYSFEDLAVPALAPRLRTPLLVFADHEDDEVPAAEGAAIAEAWPGADLALTRGLGHRRILRAPAVLERIASFYLRGRMRYATKLARS